MADQTVTIKANVQTTGLDNAVNSSSQVHDNLTASARAAQQLERSANNAGDALRRAATAGGGVQPQARTTGGATGARAAAMAGSRTPQENLEYGQMRGVAGATGASARDFANQAQGLGGLVRLYATVAANVFALTAAFGALSRAMDTTNMIAGLDALGAASGRALGTLSKELAQVSDGAISMREAMQATAMASSAGMTNKQILRMGEVAKNASLALGVSMPDAINRLSRGIVKLEPELLDELGIFTKIEPATQAYALQLGKTVTSLTDFERRQAFANAVLKEGEDKFTAIGEQIGANPYDKLSASLQNVAQSGLELVNKVLGPIADLLSKSPTVLTGGLLLLISTLVKQALPALTQYRESLDAERKKAQDLVAKKKSDTAAAGQALGELASKNVLRDMEANAESELRIFEDKEKQLNQLKKRGVNYSKELNVLLQKDIHDINQQEVEDAKKVAKARVDAATKAYNEMRRLEKKGVYTEAPAKQAIKEEMSSARLEMATVTSLERTTKAEENYTIAREKGIAAEINRLELSRQYQGLVKAEEKMVLQAKRSQILANMAYNTSLIGIVDAFKLMSAEADAAGNVGNRFTLGLRAGIAGLGAMITGALGAIGMIIQAITAAVAVFGLFDAAFTKNSKETEKFNSAIDNSESSIKAVTSAIELYEKKSEDNIKSTVALAGAFSELSDSMETSIKRFEKMQDAAGGWDMFWDKVKGVFGYGSQDKLADSLSKQLYAALDVADKFSKSGELQARLQEYLNVDNIFDEKAVKEKLKNLDSLGRQGLVGIAENFKKQFQETSGALSSFKENLDKTYKSSQEFIQGLALTDPFAKFADNFARLAIDMAKISAMGPGEQLKAIQELIENPEKLAQFNIGFVKGLFNIQEEFKQAKAFLDASNIEIDKLKRDLANLDKKIAKTNGLISSEIAGARSQDQSSIIAATINSSRGPSNAELPKESQPDFILQQQRQNLVKNIELAEAFKKDTIEKFKVFKDGSELFANEASKALKKSAEYTGIAIENSARRAANTIAGAYTAALSGPRAVQEQTRLAQSEQSMKVRDAQLAVDMLDSQDALTTAIRELTAAVSINSEMQKPDTPERAANLERIQQGKDILMATQMAQEGKSREQIMLAMGIDPRSQGRNDYANKIINAAEMAKAAVDQRKGMARAKVGEEQAKLEAIGIKGGIDERAAILAQEKQIQDITNATNQAKIAQLDVLRQIAGITTTDSVLQKASLEKIQQQASQKLEIADIDRRINEAAAAFAKTGSEAAKAEYEFLVGKGDLGDKGLRGLILQRQEQERNTAEVRKRAELLQVEIEDIKKGAELAKARADLENSKNEAQLEIRRAQFTSAAELYDIDKQLVVSKTAQFDIERANLDYIRQKGNLQSDLLTKEQEAKARITALERANDSAGVARVEQEFARTKELSQIQLSALDTEKQKRLEILEIQKQQALKQAEMAYETDQAARYADALKGAFGSTGSEFGALAEKLGNFSKSLIENNQQQIKDQEALKIAAKAREDAEITAANYRIQFNEENAELEKKAGDARAAEDRTKKKARDNELAGNAKSLAMAKTMFKEHTAAYKILAALERVQHIQRMVNMGIEFATKIGNLAAGLAAKTVTETAETSLAAGGFMARAGIYITEIFAKITSQLGVFGPPIAAGIIAAIGLAAFGGGKGGAQATGGAGGGYAASAEQQQKVQGTAFALDSQGKEVQVRRGVFGAEDEKSDAIRKSIEVIKETSVDGLAYYNGMLEALQSIDSAIGGAAKGLYGVQGLRTGSMFGTQEGASGRSGFLGIGSKSITTEIKDSGLLIQGTFKDLAAKTNQGVLELYETVATTVKRGGFLGIGGGTSTSYSTKYSEVSQNISEFFSDVFTGGFELFKQVGKKAGYTEAFVEGIVGSVDVGNLATSLRGLKGEEFERELQAVISTAFSMASEQLFPQFIQFAKFGEDLTQTVIRVVDANEKVNQQLKNIGGSGGKDYFASEKLVNLFGGLSEFISQTNDFRDKFLTDAQRLAPITQAVTTEFDRLNKLYGLGLSTSMTREQFASITAGSEGNETLYASLIKVSGGFDQVLTSLEAAAEKAEKASEKVDQLTESVLDYRNATTQLEKDLRKIRKTHTETIKELEELGQATQDNINLLAEYNKFQLLERIEQDIQKLYETRRSELDKTIDTLTQAKTRILDLRDSLLRGPQSTLTPVQKNVNLRTAYGTLLAQTTSALPEERELGRSKIVEIAQQYLQSSQEIYRSSQMYTMIYNQIISDLNTIYGDIEGELQNAKTDRRLLEESVNFLGLIKTNTENTAQKLTQLLNLYSTTNTSPGLTTTVQARATGGLASGVTLVGERGPELVDFRDPGRVYSANQTRGMFGMEQTAQYNQQMLAELRSLNEKIDCLEQVVAEGAVLNANATNKNTQQIVGAVVVNTSQTVESTRLQSRIVIK